MAVENLKSTSITNMDATPFVMNPTGVGAPGYLRSIGDSMLVSASASLASTYQLVRCQTNWKIKEIWFEAEAMGAGKFDLSVYYSDDIRDGTALANLGLVIPTTGSQFFASIIDCAAAVAAINEINESGNNPITNRNKPFWQALGLAKDPGGMFDLVAVVATTAVTTGNARIWASVHFVE